MRAFILAILGSVCTTTVVVSQSVPVDGTKMPSIRDISVFLNDSASIDFPVGVFALGPYKQSDMNKLQASLVESIASLQQSTQASGDTNTSLIVVVRSLIHQYSNKASYQFGCIAYCIANKPGNVLYQEQFYVQAKGHLTAGLVRNTLNKRITQQILNGLLTFYDGKNDNSPPKGVYNDFEEAVQTMPGTVISSDYASGSPFYNIYTGSTLWKLAEKTEPLDWDTYLNK